MIIDPEFAALIPPITEDERMALEASLLKEGCRDRLTVWKGTLLDGHNRFAICEEHGISYNVRDIYLEDRDAARLWIIDNQLGRRNLCAYDRGVLELARKSWIAAQAKERQRLGGVEKVTPILAGPTGETRDAIAKLAGLSHGTLAKIETIQRQAAPEIVKQIRAGEISISKAYADNVRATKRDEVVAKLEDLAARETVEPTGLYDVIVIDPPWPMEKIERDCRPNQMSFDYPTMGEDELAKLSIPASDDCHLFVWTTQRFLPMALRLLETWGAKYVCTFVWHKPGGFQPIGLPQYNAEFCLYARIGTPVFVDTKAFPTCFNAERGAHSEKPEEFYETLRRVTAGRRIDMFGRRSIDGFFSWGNEM